MFSNSVKDAEEQTVSLNKRLYWLLNKPFTRLKNYLDEADVVNHCHIYSWNNGCETYSALNMAVPADLQAESRERDPNWRKTCKWSLLSSDVRGYYGLYLSTDNSTVRVYGWFETPLIAIRTSGIPVSVWVMSNGDLKAPSFFSPDERNAPVVADRAYIMELASELGRSVTYVDVQ